ncbi:hypothetical protein KC19_3G109300 [Ceratodon purpureus]|uniref:Aquaporin n=1 Tax=Ceratodon purpureus TaxID=3225 RepID=A0A8T0IJI3_CERPU|nr:hypothetical protein KC19_3G109300 [Ceratodon purpureus]
MAVDHAQRSETCYQQQSDRSGFDHPGGPLDEEEGGIYRHQNPSTHSKPESAKSVTFLSTLSSVLVLQDFQTTEVWRAAAVEFIATFAMVFVGTLCTISTLQTGFHHPVLVIAIFQALTLSLCIQAAAPMSGGHVNPCITWTEMLTGHITPVRALFYITAQALGSIVASLAVKNIVGHTLAWKYMLGGCYLHSQPSPTSQQVGLQPGRALLLEIILSFFVLFIAYSVALDPQRLPRTGPRLAPFLIGILVGLCIFAGGNLIPGYAGAGTNPGRCLGPAVALGKSMWSHHWVFWAGPAVAGLAMAAMYRVIPPSHLQAYARRNAAILTT